MSFLKLKNLNVHNKTVLIRVDMNVPSVDGKITDVTRVVASLPSIQYCLENGAAVILMSHLGRPTEGDPQPKDSILPIAERLAALLDRPVPVRSDWQEKGLNVQAGEIVMLENVRLNIGEKKNSEELGRAYASLCDIYVNDAFGTAHRKEASTYAVAQFAPIACAGILLASELEALTVALENPKRPLVAIVAGSKVSTKLTILKTLAQKVDQLIVGGGIANTFLLAEGQNIGASLAEADLVDEARAVMTQMKKHGGYIPLPTDVVTAKTFAKDAQATEKAVDEVEDGEMILDIGTQSAQALANIVQQAGTIVWNGPIGVFEFPQFAQGTHTLANAIADSGAFSIAGGGDTLAAIAQFGITDKISYVSTGGGAFLEFLEGKELPSVAILEERTSS